MSSIRSHSLVVPLLAALAFGCGSGDDANRVAVHETTGKVTIDGKPLADAVVTFSTLGTHPTAVGRTDAQGVYTLTTYEAGDGAAAGDYEVLVNKETPGESVTLDQAHQAAVSGDAASPAAAHRQAAASKGEIPARYGRMSESNLSATVKEGENKFDFDLKR